MNIIMISPFDLVVSRLWGPTIRLHSLAKELTQMGHSVVVAGPPPLYGDKPQELDGIRMHYFRQPFHRYPYLVTELDRERQKHNRRCRLPLIMASRFAEIMRLIRTFKAEVLYVNRAFMDTAYPAYASHFLGRVAIICDWDDLEGLHGFSTSFRSPLHIQLLETVNETVFPRISDATVVASRFLAEFASNIGVAAEKLYYAPTVADNGLFQPSVSGEPVRIRYGLSEKKVLFYCGNLMEKNGVKLENIIYTLHRLVMRDPSYALLIVGEGDLLKKNDGSEGLLVTLARELGVSHHIHFTGGVPYKDVPSYIAAADLCLALFPINLITMSKSPLKIYEYMAMAKPVIARDVGEISGAIINGENGVLVHSDDVDEYVSKIDGFFMKNGLRGTMGSMSRKRVEETFNWRRSAEVVEKACMDGIARA